MSSSAPSVRVEKLGKRYIVPQRLAASATAGQRFRQHLKEFFPFVRGADDSDAFWALRDVSFEARPGEILGILGRNGSGKSTLLKILSGVTLPTEGRAMLRGRVGSLLEVGTGFQPDLTGRENVFMAGALLGIKPDEIRRKFDEIVDFSGIERFIDTPVKRYSSGMYVRLAYAVASQLRCDILILDEVMAVGDAEFRQKSQKNIERATADGRTVLFVSHNHRAIREICNRGIVLDGGKIVFSGTADEAAREHMRKSLHLDEGQSTDDPSLWPAHHVIEHRERIVASDTRVLRWVSTHRLDGTPAASFRTGEGMLVRIGHRGVNAARPYFSVLVHNSMGDRLATLHSTHSVRDLRVDGDAGYVECAVESLPLGDGTYNLMVDHGNFGGTRLSMQSLDCVSNAARFHVSLSGYLAGIGQDEFQGAVVRSTWVVGRA